VSCYSNEDSRFLVLHSMMSSRWVMVCRFCLTSHSLASYCSIDRLSLQIRTDFFLTEADYPMRL